MRALFLITAAAITFLVPQLAHAAPPPVELRWTRASGAEGCLGEFDLERAVTERLGTRPFSRDADRIIEGHVTHEKGRFVARIVVRSRKGELVGSREFQSKEESCNALDQLSIVGITLIIDPERAIGAGAAENPPIEAEPIEIPRPLAPVVVEKERTHVRLLFGALLVSGLSPQLAPALQFQGTIFASRHWGFNLGATSLLETRTDDQRFGFSINTFDLRAIMHTAAGPFSFEIAGGAHVGAFHATVYVNPGVLPIEPGDSPWVGLSLSARASLHLAGPLILTIGGGAFAPLTRKQLAVSGEPGPAFEQSILAPMAEAHLGIVL